MRAATKITITVEAESYISIHAAHAGSDEGQNPFAAISTISIHAAHAGSDQLPGATTINDADFNPRCPCGQRPSTVISPAYPPLDFNPRCPCGQRPMDVTMRKKLCAISIHAAHAGSDSPRSQGTRLAGNFNPRCPCGQRPIAVNAVNKIQRISIHAAHAGSDGASILW